jgi:uncharacterized protein DUF4154
MAILNVSKRRPINQSLGSWSWVWFVMSTLLFFLGENLPAQAATSKEYQVKAVFLFNFAQFVKWPAQAFPEAKTPLVIGVLGEDPFGDYLDELVRGEIVNNRSLVVKRYSRVEDIGLCHVLFISQSEARNWRKIFADLNGRNILTVGDIENFVPSGGMIGFASDKGKVRLKIDVETAEASGLTISSKLLRSAEIVTPGKN